MKTNASMLAQLVRSAHARCFRCTRHQCKIHFHCPYCVLESRLGHTLRTIAQIMGDNHA